ncbi:MAG: 6-phosphofructokinase [Clostridia bacterium]|nr:6-phosphofructokinase [Clostridia bacterium]
MKNLLVIQSGGPTAVINASLAGVIRGGFDHADKIGKVYGGLYGIEGVEEERIVPLERFKDEGLLDLLKQTPASYLGSCRKKLPLPEEDKGFYERIFAIFKKYDIGYFFCIGGNDSMDTVDKMSRYAEEIGSDVRVIGVPKTIDNDLAITDHTPGYGSSAKFIANSMRQLKKDAEVYRMPSVIVLEAMGRNAGWLTAAAALANDELTRAADIICLPEVNFDHDSFLAKVEKVSREQETVMIAVSEGIRDKDGNYIKENVSTLKKEHDRFGHAVLGGVGQIVRNSIAADLGLKVRSIELSTLQRCWASGASLCDVNEAFDAGYTGVGYACADFTGVIPGFKRISDSPYKMEIIPYSVKDIANVEKKIPAEMISYDGFGVTDEFIRYAKPLIEGEPQIKYVDGQLQFAPKVW